MVVNLVFMLGCLWFTAPMTFPTIESLSRAEQTPPAELLPMWNGGAYGIESSGAMPVGEPSRETGIWPVGQFTFVCAAHINWPDKRFITFQSVTYQVIEVIPIGNDAVLLRVGQHIPHWHAVWRGYALVPATWPAGGTTPRDIRHLRVAAIAGGMGGSGMDPTSMVIGGAPLEFRKRWVMYESGGCEVVDFRPYSPQDPMTPGITRGPDIQLPSSVRNVPKVGFVLGDSSGAVFIEDNGWWLAGLLLSGNTHVNGSSVAPLIARTPRFLELQDHFATVPSYSSIPQPSPVPTPVPLPPIVVPPTPKPPVIPAAARARVNELLSQLQSLSAQQVTVSAQIRKTLNEALGE